jgi:hypothetical protein
MTRSSRTTTGGSCRSHSTRRDGVLAARTSLRASILRGEVPTFDRGPSRGKPWWTVDPDGHWFWNGALDRDGYGFMKDPGTKKVRKAHRVIYELVSGEALRDDQELDHTCRRRRCVNPLCTEVVTKQVNTLRRDYYRALGPERMDAIRADLAADLPLSQIADRHMLSKEELVFTIRSL